MLTVPAIDVGRVGHGRSPPQSRTWAMGLIGGSRWSRDLPRMHRNGSNIYSYLTTHDVRTREVLHAYSSEGTIYLELRTTPREIEAQSLAVCADSPLSEFPSISPVLHLSFPDVTQNQISAYLLSTSGTNEREGVWWTWRIQVVAYRWSQCYLRF